ncbi:hypothetical protein UCRPC4_g06404 [Phaeomoniella chlamydospora]|uniref:EGF domain-specific O-linked N-acetylglucosamine transferase n=1 Tax=Phaeomoniella chlamydospora TaxID=158046 RepID=A0A0G2FTL3_PHACM|nr:hypothetical protein UCRPC4_g06404 [Phaeomoniella chlamydospora]
MQPPQEEIAISTGKAGLQNDQDHSEDISETNHQNDDGVIESPAIITPSIAADLPSIVSDALPTTQAKTSTAPSRTVLPPPSEYEIETEAEIECQDMYGINYLNYAATHQISYCESESNSGLQCFNAHGRPHPHNVPADTFCVAQGVEITQEPTHDLNTGASTPHPNIGMQCRLRNFTTERLKHPEKAESELKWVANIDNLETYFFDTGAKMQLYDMKISPVEELSGRQCTRDTHGNSTWILLARREGNHNIWHKFMETWQAMLTFDTMRMAINPSSGEPYMTEEDVRNALIVFDDDREEPYDDWWHIVANNGNPLLRKNDLAPGCYSNIVLPLAGSSSNFWPLIISPGYQPPCHNPFFFRAVRSRMFSHLKLTPRSATSTRQHPTMTFIDRRKKRIIYDSDHLLTKLRNMYPHSTLNVVDFSQLTLKAQVELILDTDILIGTHGSALLHLLWMHPDTAYVEIKPVSFPFHWRTFAAFNSINYFDTMAVWPEVWNWTTHKIKPAPGWKPPTENNDWQDGQYIYLDETDFLRTVDAAVRSQKAKMSTGQPPKVLQCDDQTCEYVEVVAGQD